MISKKFFLSLTVILSLQATSGRAQDITFQPPPKAGESTIPMPTGISPADISAQASQLRTQNETRLQNKTNEQLKTPSIAPLAPITPPPEKPTLPTAAQPTTVLPAIPESNLAPPAASAALPPPPKQLPAPPKTTQAQQPPKLAPTTPPSPNKPNQSSVYTGFQGTPAGTDNTTKGQSWDVKY